MEKTKKRTKNSPSKEPYRLSKEPYRLSKEPCRHSKRDLFHSEAVGNAYGREQNQK